MPCPYGRKTGEDPAEEDEGLEDAAEHGVRGQADEMGKPDQ